jgi:hypothetical protein
MGAGVLLAVSSCGNVSRLISMTKVNSPQRPMHDHLSGSAATGQAA